MEKLNTITLTILIFLTVCLFALGMYGLAFLVEQSAWIGTALLVLIVFVLSYMAARMYKS